MEDTYTYIYIYIHIYIYIYIYSNPENDRKKCFWDGSTRWYFSEDKNRGVQLNSFSNLGLDIKLMWINQHA